MADNLTRRTFIAASAAGASALALTSASAQERQPAQPERRDPTRFQISCMTLPYSQFPLERALTGLQKADYRFVAWGTNHKENDGKPKPVLADNAAPEQAKELGKRCRNLDWSR